MAELDDTFTLIRLIEIENGVIFNSWLKTKK